MTDTTWTSPAAGATPQDAPRGAWVTGFLAHLWMIRVLMPLHRALDSALRAGELRALNPATLADIGYRKV